MIASEEWLTATRATGIVAYGVAMVCCGIAWARARRRRTISQLAALLTVIEGALVLDMVFNWRWMLHQELMDLAQRWNEYEVRRSPQRNRHRNPDSAARGWFDRCPAHPSRQDWRPSRGFRSFAFACLVVHRSRLPSRPGPRLVPSAGSMDGRQPGVGFRRPDDFRRDSHRCAPSEWGSMKIRSLSRQIWAKLGCQPRLLLLLRLGLPRH